MGDNICVSTASSTADTLTALYNAADDYEAAVLDNLTIRAGLIWSCFCRWHNLTTSDTCERCGRTRQQSDHDQEEAL